MKTSYFVFAVALIIGSSTVQAQGQELPQFKRDNLLEYKTSNADSLLKRWGVPLDSLSSRLKEFKPSPQQPWSNGGMVPGTLLDNRPATTGYIQGNTKYFIQNAAPLIENKPVTEGSLFYLLK